MSLAARLLNVVAAPGEVFDDVKASAPSVGNWLVPALMLIAVSWIGVWLIFSQDALTHQLGEMTEKGIEKQIEQRQLSGAEAEQAREMGMKAAMIMAKVGAVAATPFAAFIVPFWGGLIVWLFGVKVFKGNFTYMKAVEVAGLANIIGVLDAIVRTLLVLTLGNFFASPSAALLVTGYDPQNPVHALLGLVNVMTFWALGVRAVGLARLSGASFGKSAAVVFGVWAVLTGLMMGFGFGLRAIFGGGQ